LSLSCIHFATLASLILGRKERITVAVGVMAKRPSEPTGKPTESPLSADPVGLWNDFGPPLRAFLARRVPPGVDADDLGILASNWQSTTADFLQGDFNNDQSVNINDLFILADHWQTDLPAPAAPVVSLAATAPVNLPPSRRAVRML